MKLSQAAITFFTLRDHCKTREEFIESIRKVAEIGYEAIQISGVQADLTADEIAKIAGDAGLTICATHEPGDKILESPEEVCDRLEALGCKYTAYPAPGGIDLGDFGAVKELIEGLQKASEVFNSRGLTLCYHNHGFEFIKHEGKTILEWIYEGTTLGGEIDTYWVQYGGGDPVEWCERLKGRLPLLHLKDYSFTLEKKPTFCEIGQGTLNFPKIVSAAEASGCEWFIVEQDTCPGDPFDSIKVSFDYIKEELCS